ncbi:hypothetical protein DY000_02045930 [Brassica cretica]|uniref:Uncharacterized protein n=1 Tax=Brassica cretica TaxID=69181 RepID=A0ABQ7F2I4_BRACR|nr:hypothetical protein DY000_02045930 [Brassica cretica]
MDPRNLHTQSSSYVGLLHSQQGSVFHENFPYESIKAAKAKRNTAKGKFVAEYATIWEMKKEDLEMKKKLSKLAILDTFLAKKEPLNEAEEVVKNKLLAEYL